MKTLKTILALSLVTMLGLTGCPADEQQADEAPATTQEAAQDFEAQAEKEITADNAASKADELEKELEAELDTEE